VEGFAAGPHHATVYKTLGIEALSGTEKGTGKNVLRAMGFEEGKT